MSQPLRARTCAARLLQGGRQGRRGRGGALRDDGEDALALAQPRLRLLGGEKGPLARLLERLKVLPPPQLPALGLLAHPRGAEEADVAAAQHADERLVEGGEGGEGLCVLLRILGNVLRRREPHVLLAL